MAAANAARRHATRQMACSSRQRWRSCSTRRSSSKSSPCAKFATRSGRVARLRGRGWAWRRPVHACRGGARVTPCCSGSSRQKNSDVPFKRPFAKKMVGVVEWREAEGLGWLRWKPIFDLRDHVRVRCGRAVKSAALAVQCSRMLRSWARGFVACAERRT